MLPDFVNDLIDQIVRLGHKKEDIIEYYEKILQDPFIQDDEQFKTDEEKHRYAMKVLWAQTRSILPAKEVDVIPIGYAEKRENKRGKPESTIFGVVNTTNGVKLHRIVCRDQTAELYEFLSFGSMYKNIKLGQFKSGDFQADNRTKFKDPIKIDLSVQKLLEKIGVTRINDIMEIHNNLSKVTGTGYVDRTDWKIVRGIIIRRYVNEEKGFGVYTITQLGAKEKILKNGEVIPSELTIWSQPSQMQPDENSECDFVGTIEKSKSKDKQKETKYSMNCFLILPIVVWEGS